MLSELTQAMIVNGAVLVAVLEADLGSHRKIGKMRILRPVLLAGGVVPLFVDAPVTHGPGLTLEIAAALSGLVLGLIAIAQMTIYRSPTTAKPVSRAGTPYALLWTTIIAARAAFSYGSVHWFPTQLTNWAVREHITAAALTDGLIFMAVAMLLTRTIALGIRATTLAPTTPVPTRSRATLRTATHS
jgi:hypothetical protein